jgi:hypothetical protein
LILLAQGRPKALQTGKVRFKHRHDIWRLSEVVLMRIGVIVATSGRATQVMQATARLKDQTMLPSSILISAVTERDVPPEPGQGVDVIYGSAGLCAQRNRALEVLLGGCDIIVFFDDDFVPALSAIENIHRLFLENSSIVGATGCVLADGVVRGGITYNDALAILANYESQPRPAIRTRPTTGLYGCNMAFRAAAIGTLRFDENLPLYGWQEDNDFSAGMAQRGPMVATTAFVGVHLGVRLGRTSGLRLGYSQVANPAYLARKGTMMFGYAVWLITKAVLVNHAKMLTAEPDIDRAGRARGNRKALGDLLFSQAMPQRILTLQS